MARIIKSNPLCRKISHIGGLYAEFLRVKKSLYAKSTYRIYDRLGNLYFIPQLTELTEDNMNNVDANVLRLMIDNYGLDHDEGGVYFFCRHLKTFVNWYWEEYEIDRPNPTAKVRVKKFIRKPIDGITADEINLLIRTAKGHSVFPERDIAMLMVLSDTGIRRRSLLELKMEDVSLCESQLVTHEKDQRYHIHSFGAATAKAIKKYLACLEDIKPNDPFWLRMDGVALTTYGAKEVLRRLCAEAGIKMHHFHDFRRFYALELYNSTHDIYMVSRALDHKGIEVTKRYLAIDDRENAEAVRLYSPMDKQTRQTGVRVQR